MDVVPFRREHLREMVIQQRHQGMEKYLTPEMYDLMEGTHSFTGVVGDEVLACAGVFEMVSGRALAWAYLSDNVGRRMLHVTRAVSRYLELSPYRRIEMDVDCDFEAAHRWAKLLGFELEAERRRFYTPDGRDCALYARIKNV